MPPTYSLVVAAHIPEPELDTMHAASGWRDRVGRRTNAYFDVFAIKHLALLTLSGWLPPPAQAVIERQGVGIRLQPTYDLGSSIHWPGNPATTKDFLGLYEQLFTSLHAP